MFDFLKLKPLGVRGEKRAARFLQLQGMRILQRNAQFGRYEIDIIALDGDTTVFVEVKTRANADTVSPEENVHHDKQRRIIAAARQYISAQDDPDMYYRFDIVAVVLPPKGKIEITHFRDAFRER